VHTKVAEETKAVIKGNTLLAGKSCQGKIIKREAYFVLYK
jgi:hypothetical protein